jgi:hypothetical protein
MCDTVFAVRSGETLRVVTSEQLRQGYATYDRGVLTVRDYVVVRRLADGSAVVREPTK